jgi:hypothetical protein
MFTRIGERRWFRGPVRPGPTIHADGDRLGVTEPLRGRVAPGTRVPVRPVGVGVQPERPVEEEEPAEVGEVGVHAAAEAGGECRLHVAVDAVLQEQFTDFVGVAGARSGDVVAAAGEGEAREGQSQESGHGRETHAGTVPLQLGGSLALNR